MSSFITLPSLPVAFTLERSTLFFLAMLRTAGVARALWLDSSTALERGVLPTGLAPSSDDDEELLSAAAFFS